MKKWFYKNVALIYIIAMASITTGALCFVHKRVSKETFDALCSIAFAINFMVVASAVLIGIWGVNKLKKNRKRRIV